MSKSAKLSLLILILLLVGSLFFAFVTMIEKDQLSTVNKKLTQDLNQARQKESKTRQDFDEAKRQFDDEMRQRDDKLKVLNDQLADLQKEKEALSTNIAAFDGEKQKLQTRIDEARQNRDELVQKLQDADQRTKQAEEAQKALEEQVKQMQVSQPSLAVSAAFNPTPTPDMPLTPNAPSTEMAGAERTPSTINAQGRPNNEEYWASVLRDKAGLEIELKKVKDQLSLAQIDVVELKRVNDEYKVKMDQLAHDKGDIEQEIQFKSDLVNNLSIELARTKNDKKFITDRAEELNKENTELRSQLQQLVATKGALEKSIVKISKEKSDVEGKLGQTDSLIQSKIDEIWEIKESIDSAFQASKKDIQTNSGVELPPIVVKADGNAASFNPGASAPGFNGKVVSINAENNFVIVDLGKNSGVRIGDQLSVYRNSKYIARLEVIQVRNDISAADIKDQWAKIQAGDLIR